MAVIKNSGVVPVGYFASYLLLIKTVPGDFWPYTINVSVSTTGLSVCSVRVIQVGASCYFLVHGCASQILLSVFSCVLQAVGVEGEGGGGVGGGG